jgi:hypothetical protein
MVVGTPGSGTVAIKEDQSRCDRGKHSMVKDEEVESAEDDVEEETTGCGITAATTWSSNHSILCAHTRSSWLMLPNIRHRSVLRLYSNNPRRPAKARCWPDGERQA